MKKALILFCLLNAAALAAVWLHAGTPMREPPDLTVTCRGRTVTAWRGTYSWQWTDHLGSGEGVSSDSPHPLDVLKELPVLEAGPGDKILLSFSVEPDSITAARFSSEGLDSEEIGLETGHSLALPEMGGHSVYMVQARWDQTAVSGAAVYAFYIP